MLNRYHKEILLHIIKLARKPTQHTFLDGYLGNDHPRYAINVPTLRKIAKSWMSEHPEVTATQFASLLTSLIRGRSSTEKYMAGILLNYSTSQRRTFDPRRFNAWLDHLEGWAEIDSICTGSYSVTEVKNRWIAWRKLLISFSRSTNINKQRASLVFLCSPLRLLTDIRLAELALVNVDTLRSSKDGRITKAISWVLRSMEKHYRPILSAYVEHNKDKLPKIAVRETLMKLKTGVKSKRKVKTTS
jgi:3-methyladenine DNA glycosylase AlkD